MTDLCGSRSSCVEYRYIRWQEMLYEQDANQDPNQWIDLLDASTWKKTKQSTGTRNDRPGAGRGKRLWLCRAG